MNTLKNEFIEIEVADHGAELQSLRKNGKEYLWQGDARYWGRRSPVLFPMVGRVWGDVYRHNGRKFELGQHGFARDMDFTLISRTDSSLTYRLRSNESTLQLYPFDFTLDITYRIDGSTLAVSWSVTNDSTEVMPFQIGAHPAFMISTPEPRRGHGSISTAPHHSPTYHPPRKDVSRCSPTPCTTATAIRCL